MTISTPSHTIERLLFEAAARINVPQFIADDPVQFPHRFSSLPDIEISALLSATLAWGKRTMICRDCERLFDMMGASPYEWVMSDAVEALDPSQNIHRTFFARNLRHYVAGLRRIYSRYSTLQEFAADEGVAKSEFPAWHLAAALNREFKAANNGCTDSRCLPLSLQTTALKRLNMALRWLVRNDGMVDLGVWDILTPAQLFIPLDVHAATTARSLGLLKRASNDRKAAVELTETMRAFSPDDPALLDFALFGLGISGEIKSLSL